MKHSTVPGLVFQPQTQRSLLAGIRQINTAIRPALGPNPRAVAIEDPLRAKAPELLTKGALIARRITDLPERSADVGAMLLRHMLWRQYELLGDGTATAALLFESLFADCVRYLAAGYDAQALKKQLLAGLDLAQKSLRASRITLDSAAQQAEDIEKLALAVCQAPALAAILGEAFATLGLYGQIDVQRGYSRQSEREYIQGVFWPGGSQSAALLADRPEPAQMTEAALFLSDLDFDDPRALMPIIEAAHQRAPALIIVCNEFSSRAVGLLTHINKRHQHFQALAVKLAREPSLRLQMLEELALMSGGRAFLQERGDRAATITPAELGYVPAAWLNKDFFCISQDRDNGESRAAFLLELEAQYQRAPDAETRAALRQRIGRLMGASAVIRVGGASEKDIKSRRDEVESAVKTLRAALESGVVLGGGIALLQCQPTLRRALGPNSSAEKRAAYNSLSQALAQPARQICVNAGAPDALAALENAPPQSGYDVRTGCIVNMRQAGILDAYEVLSATLENAVRTAALALTIDVIVHQRQPEYSKSP